MCVCISTVCIRAVGISQCLGALCMSVCVCVCVFVCLCVWAGHSCGSHALVEVGLRYAEEAAVAVGSHGEDERLAGEHGQVADQFPRVRHEQAAILLAVDHVLIHMQRPRDDEQHAHVLGESQAGR